MASAAVTPRVDRAWQQNATGARPVV